MIARIENSFMQDLDASIEVKVLSFWVTLFLFCFILFSTRQTQMSQAFSCSLSRDRCIALINSAPHF